MTIFYFYKYN